MRSKIFLFIFLAIILLGIVLRFYQLGGVPPSLNWDEVSWGYNAYSVGTTGKDEYGLFLPSMFKAFGDYKQPVYVYLDIIPTILWGLSGFSVRFPSAFFGSLSIIAVFLLAKELFFRERYRDYIALVVMFLFSISPWSIQFSRVAYEANVGVFFTIAGVWLFLRGLRLEKIWMMTLAAVLISISCYTYHSQKLFTPLLFIALLFHARDFLLRQKKALIVLLIVFFLSNIFWAIDTQSTKRGRSVTFVSDQTKTLAPSLPALNYDKEQNNLLGLVFHNRRVVYINKFVENYLTHFDPSFLFVKGDGPRHHPPFMGNLYLVSLPFILFGIFSLIKSQRKISAFIFVWLFLAPVASSLAIEAPNASRSLVFLPTWQIFEAIGIVNLFLLLKSRLKKAIVVGTICGLYGINILFYMHNYYSHTSSEYASSWQYGYKEAVEYIGKYRNSEKRIFFSKNFENPYIFYLFYSSYDADNYISTGGSRRIINKCHTIDNVYFGDCMKEMKSGDIYISFEEEDIADAKELKQYKYHNGEVANTIYQLN